MKIQQLINPKALTYSAIIVLLVSGSFSCSRDDARPDTHVSDIDGNHYKTVQLGTQTWMVENLKVTHYRNGDAIPNVTDQTAWGELESGGYCNQSNDAGTVDVYGRLYNWYALNDSRKVAPKGWHVPSDEEWATLITYLGGNDLAGGAMKETGTSYWCNPNVGATNQSGFTARPAGVRSLDYFLPGCEWALFWSVTEDEDDLTTAFNQIIFDNSSQINRVNNVKGAGMSVRCLKD